ncbi:MAG: thermonuclease family protein [Patescibacteria group bacterium]|nr:thermonuclease family protein [Patescibacteria group bacterium]MDD5172798.1 thermonuclease family protein [Patescibacteria group bacterium]
MDKLEMKKIKKLLLSFIIALGTILGVIALMESTNSSLLKKILGGLLIAVVALFGIIGLNESGPVSEDTAVVEVGSGISVVTVTGVIDGDTIEVDDGVVVRLIGIDAPEQGECYYREAKEMMKELVLGKEIRLEKDISGTDNLDRLLRYVVLPSGNQLADDTFVNNYMVRYGYARLMTMAPDHKYLSLLTASREQAISNKEGMWTDCLDEMHNTELGEMGDQPLNPNCLIKGNISLKAYGKTYFTPDCYNYNQVKIKFDEGEKYFCTEQEALEAGFRKSDTCP